MLYTASATVGLTPSGPSSGSPETRECTTSSRDIRSSYTCADKVGRVIEDIAKTDYEWYDTIYYYVYYNRIKYTNFHTHTAG